MKWFVCFCPFEKYFTCVCAAKKCAFCLQTTTFLRLWHQKRCTAATLSLFAVFRFHTLLTSGGTDPPHPPPTLNKIKKSVGRAESTECYTSLMFSVLGHKRKRVPEIRFDSRFTATNKSPLKLVSPTGRKVGRRSFTLTLGFLITPPHCTEMCHLYGVL